MTDAAEDTAQRIAEKGRDALLARLRPAFAEAARAHSDVLSLDADQLEQIVQRAADRSDGLQWRRALADVAAEELDISLGEALSHPAVARAQAIVGAPSYEDSLAALGPPPSAQGSPAQPSAAEEEHEAAAHEDEAHPGQPAADEAEAAADEAEAPADEAEAAHEEREGPEEAETEHERPAGDESPATADAPAGPSDAGEGAHSLRLAAVHIGGIANLEPSEQGIALLLSEDGLDIARGPDELLGRLRWPEIRSLDVSPPRGRRRRKRAGAHLVIRTRHGDATFEIPDASTEELQTQLQPLLQRHATG